MATLTQEEAHRLFEYRDGALFWKIRPANCIHIGDEVGGTNGKKEPYLRARIGKARYMVHKLIFLWHHGFLPEIVDHIDGNIQNNKIENLRQATKSQNAMNKKLRSDSSTGIKNVLWNKRFKKWIVKIGVNRTSIFCGYFDDLELAELVAVEAAAKFHQNFAYKGA